jgi:prolipoprotein diacylglyceryltransferase
MSPGNAIYALTTVAGIGITMLLWRRMTHAGGRVPDPRLPAVYGGALAGAYLGAKAAFLLAEGWAHRHDWTALASGHSVTGALLGGVLGVESMKRMLGYREGTGDLFAVTVPAALAIGRIGCMAAGCCQGVECEPAWWTTTDPHGHARWPAPMAELAFNAAFLAWVTVAMRRGWQRGQRFNDYLMAYGCFRFAHEFVRDDTRWWGAFGGYHAAALALVATGAWMHAHRRRASVTPSPAA